MWALVRTPVYAPESMLVDDLLHTLQRRKVHNAIILDEYGGTAGLITIEDLIEQIVGEIQDEYDEEEPMISVVSPTEARIDGRASIDDFADHFDLDLSEDEDREEYDTVGGLIYHRVKGIPRAGDRVVVQDRVELTVESTIARRVSKVRAVRLDLSDERATGDDEG
jgi:hypothetical protein